MKITPETAPVGARLLVKRRGSSFDEPFEVVIVEWSPSGRAVKWRSERGGENWTEDAVRYGVLVEKLPSAGPCKMKFNEPEPHSHASDKPCDLGHDNPNMRDKNAVLLKDSVALSPAKQSAIDAAIERLGDEEKLEEMSK